jgi:prevent-host-death family protein
MKHWNLNDAKTHLSSLVNAAARGEEIVITRYGHPLARLGPAAPPQERPLGFYPIAFTSDLTESTDADTVRDFEEA